MSKILTQVTKHYPGYKAVNQGNLVQVCKIWKWFICHIPFTKIQYSHKVIHLHHGFIMERLVFSGRHCQCDSTGSTSSNQNREEKHSAPTTLAGSWDFYCSDTYFEYSWLLKKQRLIDNVSFGSRICYVCVARLRKEIKSKTFLAVYLQKWHQSYSQGRLFWINGTGVTDEQRHAVLLHSI